MHSFSNNKVGLATEVDVAAIVTLLNQAYRGEGSKKGWTTEADLIAGEIRTNATQVLENIDFPKSVFLLSKNNEQTIACVNLQLKDDGIYLGMFAVNPDLQGGGVGKAILAAAEEWALYNSSNRIYMIVISLRKELIDWYLRNGYRLTGKSFPFKEDDISGKHLKQLEFVELEKSLR